MTNGIPDLNDIAENLAELLTNSVNIVDKYYDMFFNETPMLVELQQYNSQGELITHHVPNLAMNRSIALSGEVDPENNVSANLGQLYVNTITRNVFLKATATGNTGWVNITPGKMYIMRETFSISSETTSVTLTQNVGSKDHTILFLNSKYIDVSQYNVTGSTLNLLFDAPDNSILEVRYFINVATADSEVIRTAQSYANDAKNYRDQTIALQISTITIGNVEDSETAYVVNSGTPSNQIWDIGLPQGPQGPEGPEGPQGKSVVSVELLATAGIHKTYRMTFSDGSYYDYVVDDGEPLPTSWGMITGTLSNQTDLQNALNGKQDVISDITTIRDNANEGHAAYDIISGYGNIVTHNVSEFATAAQGAKADTAVQIGDPISYFQNDVGYITGINSADVIGALGYTPYNATNPNSYITLNSLSSSSNSITYNNGNGVFSVSPGYSIPTTAQTNLIDTALQPNALSGYATEEWVEYQNYITLGSLSSTAYEISYDAMTGEIGLNEGYQIPLATDVALIPTALQPSDIEDNLTSSSATKILSANQGRILDEKISAVSGRGKFLAVWDPQTGLPSTNPGNLPYTYVTGDYYIIGDPGAINYKPSGSSYNGTASTTVETHTIYSNDTYIYDGTNWTLLHTDVGSTTFESLVGQPTDNTNLATALNGKVTANNAITGATKCKITYDSKGLVTGGANLSASDIPNLTLSKITDVTASASEVNILDGAIVTTSEINYLDGLRGNIQAQLDDAGSYIYNSFPFTIIGNPTITNDGILSNCTINDYITCSPILWNTANTWDVYIKFTTGSDINTSQVLINTITGNSVDFDIVNEKFRIALGTGSSWDIVSGVECFTVTANTSYFVKASFTGSAYTISYSTSGFSDLTLAKTITSSTKISSDTTKRTIGNNRGQGAPFLGSIDLKQLVFILDNERVVEGMLEGTEVIQSELDKKSDLIYNSSVYNIVGSPTITDSGIVSNLSGSNYIQTPNIALNAPYIMQVQFKSTNFSTQLQPLLIYSSYNRIITNTNGSIRVFSDPNNATDNHCDFFVSNPLVTNTNYLLTYTHDGHTTATMKVKNLDTGLEQFEVVTFAYTFPTSSHQWTIGSDGSRYVLGSMDLRYVKITSNNSVLFTGYLQGTKNIAKDADVVKLTGNQTVAGVKTFTSNPVFKGNYYNNQLTAQRDGTSGVAGILCRNNNTIYGTIGMTGDAKPTVTSSNAVTYNIVRNATIDTATGSQTKPVYIDANGIAQIITSYEGNSATATKATQDSDGSQINAYYSKRRGDITGAVDWNNYTDYGCYKVQKATMTADYNAPVGEYSHGLLVVEKSAIAGENRTLQIYYPHQPNSGAIMWIRMTNNSVWKTWTKVQASQISRGSASLPVYFDANGNAQTITSYSGNAATASKLGTSTLGSVTQPIYLNGGTATLCNQMCDLATAQSISGAKTFSSAITTGNNVWNNIGDDAKLGDHNVGGHICIKPSSSTFDNSGGISFHNSSDTALVQLNASSGALTSSGSLGVNNNACKMTFNNTTESLEFNFA